MSDDWGLLSVIEARKRGEKETLERVVLCLQRLQKIKSAYKFSKGSKGILHLKVEAFNG